MFLFDWNVKIQSQELVCEQPLNNRCVTVFTFTDNSGNQIKTSLFIYLFGPEKLLVGDHIEKDRFTFGYKINGIEKFWGHWETILKFFMAGIILLAVWLSPIFRPE
jgi:hypothetical protein